MKHPTTLRAAPSTQKMIQTLTQTGQSPKGLEAPLGNMMGVGGSLPLQLRAAAAFSVVPLDFNRGFHS